MIAPKTEVKFSFRTYRGAQIAEVTETLFYLSKTIFRDFPYLFDGSTTTENYMERYAKMQHSFALIIHEGNNLVGAATACLLNEEWDIFRTPYKEAGFDLEKTFYFGEGILLPPYRGMGLYKTMMNERIQAAKKYGATKASFISVVRPSNHLLRPANYQELTPIWNKYGFFKDPKCDVKLSWKDVDKPEPDLKTLNAWVKDIA